MFDTDKCLNCDARRVEGLLFCEECDPDNNEELEYVEYLPTELVQDTIADMEDGDEGYTLPWAVFADSHGKLWIAGTYPFYNDSHGTVKAKIKKDQDCVLVDQGSLGDHKFNPGEPTTVGLTRDDWIPVKLVRRLRIRK